MSDDIAIVNLRWAMALVEGLVASGVNRVVISPGSRSTPLALAFLRHPLVRGWIQVDERSAAFFALGLAKADRQPVVLVCTSGSAPANWFPAVIEAGYGKTPLILLTADRPPELRDCGANQTIDQVGLFGSHVRASHELPPAAATAQALAAVRRLAARATDQSRWPLPGPVHINVPLREPLVPVGVLPEWEVSAVPVSVSYPLMLPSQPEMSALAVALSGRPGLIVCGEDAYGEQFPVVLAQLAEMLSCPVLADPLANLRFGLHDRSHILSRYDAFLRHADFAVNHRPKWVLRFGAMPVSKQLQLYLSACTATAHILVEPYGRWPDPLHQTSRLVRADPAAVCSALLAQQPHGAPATWLDSFIQQEQRVAELLKEIEKPPEAGIVAALLAQMGSDGCLFSGNSMAIRDLDSFAAGSDAALRIVGNRGASGIDGNVSTALGLATGLGRQVVALLGDLTFYHDMNGLLAARDVDITFVVINNGGGGIFGYLPQAGLADFERAWLTPTGLDFSLAARMYGLNYRRVASQADFDAALSDALAHDGPDMIEVQVKREDSAAGHRLYWAAAGV
ncbi:MAG: 2-succinyl-5-enolpyruvyl-6-hydroxy-3-cyclohexene-1-carboxylic-acid synthase [Sulfuricella sp.]|nr:2-succinyl-5-enolpyruvyl-6-hydroxy-3-cyclohexene-1-carboxylic-acid synthase [Sulfuricella sp.]